MPQKQVGVRGKVINSQSREVIANVLKFMKQEANKGAPVIPITNYKQRLLQATGISARVYSQIVKDMELIETGRLSTFTAPVRGPKPKFAIEALEEDTKNVTAEKPEITLKCDVIL